MTGRATANLGVCVLDPRFKAECEAVALLVGPPDALPWLTAYFVHWASPLASEWSVALMEPTRTEMKDELTFIVEATNALETALGNPVTTAFLERAHGFSFSEKFAGLQGSLRSIRNYAYVSASSSVLSDAEGKTKRGRGNVSVAGADNPKVFCALIVAEAWKFERGKYPASKNEAAATAAIAFWSVSGGAPSENGWGNKRERAWRPYFERAQNPKHNAKRAECLRILSAAKSAAVGI